jgi:hypothetical protein
MEQIVSEWDTADKVQVDPDCSGSEGGPCVDSASIVGRRIWPYTGASSLLANIKAAVTLSEDRHSWMIPFRSNNLRIWIWPVLIAACATARADDPQSVCASPEIVLQRYVDAVGGKAVFDIQSRTITAKETNLGFGTEHYIYKFKWKAPNKVTAGSTPYLMGIFPVSYPNGTFKFDGEGWSDFLGRKPRNGDSNSHRNEDSSLQRQRELAAKYLYNESPQFLEFRVLADPLMIARGNELYSSFEADTASTGAPGLCILRASQVRLRRNQRQDVLYFDAVSGLLKTWQIHTGFPPDNNSVEFEFGDYREVGAIKFPFYVHVDSNDMTFRYTSVVENKRLADSEFAAKP